MWVGLGAAIKATPLLFLGLFGLRLRVVAVLLLLATVAAATLLPDFVFPRGDGKAWWRAWYDVNLAGLEVGGTASAQGAWNSHSILNQSLSGTLVRLFTPVTIADPSFVLGQPGTVLLTELSPGVFKAVSLAAQLGVLAVISFGIWRAGRQVRDSADAVVAHRLVGLGEVAAIVCGMVLLSPQSSKSHFCVWLFPVAFVVDRLTRGRRDPLALLLFAAAAITGLLAKDMVGRQLGNQLLGVRQRDLGDAAVPVGDGASAHHRAARRGTLVIRGMMALWLGMAACAEPPSAPQQPAAQEPAPTKPAPFELLKLPKVLREVSGVVALDGEQLLCVQDEVGALFTIVLSPLAVSSQPFGPKGDYEGLALVGRTPWCCAATGGCSNWAPGRRGLSGGAHGAHAGALHRLGRAVLGRGRARLLVMPKDRVGDDKQQRDERPVFAVDPKTGEVAAKPVLVLSRKALIAAATAAGLALPTRTTDKGRERVELELTCSELCLVPGKRELLLLSAVDHLLLRVDLDGRLLATRLLDRELLPQPEGMTFLPDGRLVVASEGDGGEGGWPSSPCRRPRVSSSRARVRSSAAPRLPRCPGPPRSRRSCAWPPAHR